jgi:hypothetical protein
MKRIYLTNGDFTVNDAAIEHHGEFATLNIIEEDE